MTESSRLERVTIVIAVLASIFLMFSIVLIGPSHGAVVECNVSPGHDGARWMWREIDGRRCWFKAPKRNLDQPKEKLRWRAK